MTTVTKSNIVVLGFYNRKNLGDDLFQYILTHHFSAQYQLTFINPDDVDELPSPVDVIVVGGGDLINDYFMDNIRELIDGCKCPIYGIGLGFPYPQLITAEYLNIFDFIHTRTNNIIPQLTKIMSPSRLASGVDLVRFIPENPDIHFNLQAKPIGVFLANTICTPEDPLTDKIVDVIKYVASITDPVTKQRMYHIYIYSMNTSNTSEDDDIINWAVYNKLTQTKGETRETRETRGKRGQGNITLVHKSLVAETAVTLFSQLYASICTRFHAHVLSIIAKTPFISLYSTFKVDDLLNQEGLAAYGEKMAVEPKTLKPIDFNTDSLKAKFDSMVKNYDHIKATMKASQDALANDPSLNLINNLFYYKPRLSDLNMDNVMRKIGKYLMKIIKEWGLNTLGVSGGCGFLDKPGFFKNVTPAQASFIAEAITFCMYRSNYQSFTWGLAHNLIKPDFVLKDAVQWIRNNHNIKMPYLSSATPTETRMYNMTYFDQDLSIGIHRSGWQYVVDNLKMYHNPEGPIFDSYLDKTFGWKREFYEKVGVLPLRKPWLGVFHHTPSQSYDKNNLADVIKQPIFIKSLKYCKCIIVLSNYLKTWLDANLVVKVPVAVLYHPSETATLMWSEATWTNNMDKKLIQIGAWLRDTFAIVALPKPDHIRKCALKGMNMNNYYPTPDFMEKLQVALYNANITPVDPPLSNSNICICRNNTNKFVAGMYEWLNTSINSIEIMNNVDNPTYDKLLSENVVFIKLLDASACNTIIECILRNTPILVNRLPAVEEYLGADYPLYYSTYEEAMELVNNNDNIVAASQYLSKKDKTFLNIETFLGGLQKL